jgi:hypothetical protein
MGPHLDAVRDPSEDTSGRAGPTLDLNPCVAKDYDCGPRNGETLEAPSFQIFTYKKTKKRGEEKWDG